MKKLLFIPLILLSFLSLVSCKDNIDYTYVEAFYEKETYKDYLSTVEFETSYIFDGEGDGYSKDQSRFEIFLPKDIISSSRVTKTNIEEIYDKRYEAIQIPTYSFSDLSQVSATLTSTLNSKANDIKTVYNSDFTFENNTYTGGLKLSDSFIFNWIRSFTKAELKNFSAKEDRVRSVLTVYMPVKVEFYQAKKNSDAVKTLTTHLLLPIKTTLAYLDTDLNILEENNEFNGFEEYTINVDQNRLLK